MHVCCYSYSETLKDLQKNGEIDEKLRSKITPQHSYLPQLYGLPKLHKPNIPLRPIVSSIGSTTYQLAKELTRVLSPLRGQTDSYIKNSHHFVQKISSLSLGSTDIMVSFDVKSLFTKVPIVECLDIIKQRLEEDDTLADRTLMTPLTITNLVKRCMDSTFFGFDDEIYEQVEGAPMGSPLSPVIADLYMEFFEQMAIETSEFKPDLWYRYVDDTFVLWKHGMVEIRKFLNHLNSLRDSIEFTMETETDGKLPFLDVLVTKVENQLSTTIYRKPTHTDLYLNYNSNHHPRIKSGVITCLAHRARTICSEENIPIELDKLKHVFELNDYPPNFTTKCLNSKPRQKQQIEDEIQPPFLNTPYVKGFSEKLEKSCRNLNIRATFTSRRTLKSELVHVKGQTAIETHKGVVYKVDCTSCDQSYVGETGRTLKVRIKEHERAVRVSDTTNGIAVHSNNFEHQIDWKSAKVIHHEPHYYKRKVVESLNITGIKDKSMNLDVGLRLNPTWQTLKL